MRSILITVSLVLFATVSPASAKDNELLNAAVRLKKAAVIRTWESCLNTKASKKTCKGLISIIHQRELKVVTGIGSFVKNPKINQKRLSSEMSACDAMSPDYNELVNCQGRLLDRIKAALKGDTLLNK